MTSTTVQGPAAAAAFADRLPTSARTTVRPSTATGDTGDAVLAKTVGGTSAEFAALILDDQVLIGAGEVPLPELLHDALEAAAATFGPGVAGTPTVGDASELFTNPTSEVFDLVDADGRTIGRFAVRVSRTAAASAPGVPSRLHRIANVEMDLSVEVGRTRMSIRDVIDLEPGRIIELDRSAGAPADIKVNGRLIAQGDIVVVDQDYAVRITRIIENAEV